ncbi:MAG TPA: PIG-L family deacetylase [Aquabacterium sp.]|nr:PIG-L family deacetylase [Aquabacterium sp.]
MIDGIKKAAAFLCHTDDEFICAGTLHRLASAGCEVHVVAFSPAAICSDRMGTEESSQAVLPEWHLSMDMIGVLPECRHFLNFTPSVSIADRRQDVANYVFDFCERERPDVAFILSPDDENTAHAVVGVECERVMRGRVPITLRCHFPWNYSIGRSALYVTLSDEDMEIKRQVIEAYQSQKFRYRYGEMLLGYCRAQGLSVKREAAEVFEVVRAVL